MTKPLLKTMAQQRLEWLESLDRPLTDQESDDLRRAMHAVYCREQKRRMIEAHRNEELKLLERLRAEARMPVR